MNRSAHILGFAVFALAGLGGCSGERPSKEAQTAGPALDKIQGKAQLVLAETTPTDAAMNAGGPSVYIWEGVRRYRLFFRAPVKVEGGKEYIVEGIHAQRVIDEIGDPDQGKGGYPLQSSCERVVRMAWSGLAFDVTDTHAAVLRARVRRYPARPVLLVTKLTPVASEEGGGAAAEPKEAAKAGDKEIPEVAVPADKQRAFLIEGRTVHPAPLWQPAGGTARCKVIIDEKGRISELQTGVQLCEAVPWDGFRYQPPVQGGRPVRVRTEVEVLFEPRT